MSSFKRRLAQKIEAEGLAEAYDAQPKRTLRRPLTKQDIRDVLKQAFPGQETVYVEESFGLETTGTIGVNGVGQRLHCKRGQERDMRQAFLDLIQEIWAKTQVQKDKDANPMLTLTEKGETNG